MNLIKVRSHACKGTGIKRLKTEAQLEALLDSVVEILTINRIL